MVASVQIREKSGILHHSGWEPMKIRVGLSDDREYGTLSSDRPTCIVNQKDEEN